MDFKKELAKLLQKATKQNVEQAIEIPPDSKMGDLAFPCFSLAKSLKKSPAAIAKDLASKLKADFIHKVEAKGPYVNVFLKPTLVAEAVLTQVETTPKKVNKTIVIECAGPNTNKPLHLGHLRNIFLGQSAQRIQEYAGNTVKLVNINNDRGIHICKSMLAYQKWGKNKKPNKKTDHFVGDFYVLYSKHENDELKEAAEQMLVKWEANDPPTKALWKKMNKWALDGFRETYKRLNLKFRKEYSESDHYGEGKKIVLEALEKGTFFRDEKNAVCADLTKFGLDKKVLLRPDGTSIYITQDINLAILRQSDFKFDQSVYVVASEQNYHFKALFAIFELLKYKFAKKCYHLSYGLVNLPEGRMKSREGTIVDADDLLDEMEKLATAEIKKRYKNLSKKEIAARAKMIGHGALRFFILKMDAVKDMVFNPKESLSFEGETGPYVQYAHARICSILRKEKAPKKVDYKLYDNDELQLIKKLGMFNEITQAAAEQYRPHLIAHYVLELAQLFNTYYSSHPILKAKKEIKEARLLLINKVKFILHQGLQLLHIDVPEQM